MELLRPPAGLPWPRPSHGRPLGPQVGGQVGPQVWGQESGAALTSDSNITGFNNDSFSLFSSDQDIKRNSGDLDFTGLGRSSLPSSPRLNTVWSETGSQTSLHSSSMNSSSLHNSSMNSSSMNSSSMNSSSLNSFSSNDLGLSSLSLSLSAASQASSTELSMQNMLALAELQLQTEASQPATHSSSFDFNFDRWPARPLTGLTVPEHRNILGMSPSRPFSPSSSSDSTGLGQDDGTVKVNRKFKTEFCKSFRMTGHCGFGDGCRYAHFEDDLREIGESNKYKTKRCNKFWTSGTCPYGRSCTYLHDEAVGGRELAARQKQQRLAEFSEAGGLGGSSAPPQPGGQLGLPEDSPRPLERMLVGSGRLARLDWGGGVAVGFDVFTNKVTVTWDPAAGAAGQGKEGGGGQVAGRSGEIGLRQPGEAAY